MKLIIAFLLIFLPLKAFADNYSYKKLVQDKLIGHIIKINPNAFNVELVKANSDLKRETVRSIAKRSNAHIAINAGFFEIDGYNDGKASLPLVINGNIYNINNTKQPLLVIRDNNIKIGIFSPEEYKNDSLVAGIPLLIKNGAIQQFPTSDFYSNKHARTAIGLNNKGEIIIVVIENIYNKDIKKLTINDLHILFKEKGKVLAERFGHQNYSDITLNQLKQIIKQEYLDNNGLSIYDLAIFMKKLGCVNAINLDGGGSSSLWINNEIVNKVSGDHDESLGEFIERPVSDALVFIQK